MRTMAEALFILCFSTIMNSHAKLPSVIQRCPKTLSDPRNCIRNAVEHLRPHLATGDWGEDFQVPALEPLFLESIQMNRGPNFNANFTNIVVHGPSKWILDEQKLADVDKLDFDFVLTLPRLDFEAKYSLNIRVAILRILGKGTVTGYFRNSRARVRVRGFIELDNGKNYVRFHRIKVRIQIPETKIQLKNLFDGDPTLGYLANRVINENSQEFLLDLIPGLENSLSDKFTEIVNNVLKDVTLEEMFPEKL